MAANDRPASLAVLIDADNTRARYAEAIFEEIVKLGEANVRRIYGDFSGTRLSGWNRVIQSLAILQHQQRNNTTGKNAADIALVIDAMDLMHKGKLDGFCLVSSDSDFTRLAQRLREDGLVVYGFGERKTPEAFRSACNRFIYVDNLMEAGEERNRETSPTTPPPGPTKEPPRKAIAIIAKAMEDADDDGWTSLSRVGDRIQGAVPDFDPRTYGCSNLSKLVESTKEFEVRKTGTSIDIRRKTPARKGKKKAAEGEGQ